MYLHSIATALPDAMYTQEQCWELADRSGLRQRLKKRSMLILQNILCADNGIERRHFALPNIEEAYELSPDQLNAAFRIEGPRLASRALTSALERAELRAGQLDALLICTCTGYLCPGLTSYVAEQLGIPSDAILQDLVGLGCGAAIPMMRAASHLLAAQPDAIVGCVAVEVCSAAFYLDDDLGVLVSACLFGDGAAATIWRSEPGMAPLRALDFRSTHLPAERDKLRFEQRGGKLRNLLHRAVPELAATAVAQLWRDRGERPVARVITHTGGRDVLTALAPVVAPHSLDASARVLRRCGNMSSPSVLFALEEALQEGAPNGDGDFWLVSFGAGFSAHSCRLAHG